jgi:hypothetical protein
LSTSPSEQLRPNNVRLALLPDRDVAAAPQN